MHLSFATKKASAHHHIVRPLRSFLGVVLKAHDRQKCETSTSRSDPASEIGLLPFSQLSFRASLIIPIATLIIVGRDAPVLIHRLYTHLS